jgi:hypothetical protein
MNIMGAQPQAARVEVAAPAIQTTNSTSHRQRLLEA